MTDREVLLSSRIKQAEETLSEVKRMLEDNYSCRSIINRAYYVMYYSILALFIFSDYELKTSKHSGIISTFDKNFVHKGIFEKKYSKMLHILFDMRQEYDYKDLVEASHDDAKKSVDKANDFYNTVIKYIKNCSS